jgi:GTP-binding protein HflX
MRPETYDVNSRAEDRAILVSLITGRREEALAEGSLQELVRLAETASVKVLDTVTQHRQSVDPAWFIGKGKVDELKAMAQALEANTAIFDQELSGAQVRNLEHALDVKIIDRTQLILDIFAQRAKTREGILQVELAQLSYLLPRLSGHGKNLSRLGGGIGTRGPGETKLETDRRHIRSRISELRRQLEEVVRHRKLHRERRKKSGIIQAALVGYTNAGKSTLLRQLTRADVYVENLLFATLDPTSRLLELPGGGEIVLTDTVGFIQNLPHDLVAAFRATLEEVCEADLILHVVDSSSPLRNEQMRVVDEVLEELGARGKERVTIFNKIDLCSPEERDMLYADGPSLKISAYEPEDLERLKEAIQAHLAGETKVFSLPTGEGELQSLVYRVGDVVEQAVKGERIVYTVKIHRNNYAQLGYRLAQYEMPAEETPRGW